MTTEVTGTSSPEADGVFSGVSSPLSSAPSSPVMPVSGRPKRQAALRATEKLTSIIQGFGAFDDFPRANKRSREDTPEFEDSRAVTKSISKRLRTREFSEIHSKDVNDEAETDIDAEHGIDAEHEVDAEHEIVVKNDMNADFVVNAECGANVENNIDPNLERENVPLYPAAPENHEAKSVIPFHMQADAMDMQLANVPLEYYVEKIMFNLRAIVNHQAVTQHGAVDPFLAHQQFFMNEPVFDQNWYNPHTQSYHPAAYPFVAIPPVVNLLAANSPLVNPPMVDPFVHPDPAHQAGQPLPFYNHNSGALASQIPIWDSSVYPFVASRPAVGSPVVGLPAIDPHSPILDVAQYPDIDDIIPQAANIKINLAIAPVADKDEETAPVVKLAPRVPVARPAPRGPPPIHSRFRGGLCEALPYYKSYKSSLYNIGLLAKGFLIDLEVEKGDVFHQSVVISAVGGGRVREGSVMVRGRDADDNATNVRSIKNAYEQRTLIAIIAGENHPLYPCQPPAPYAVLDWFHITYMWKEILRNPETQRIFSVWRIRFEKANPFTPSWWIPAGQEEIVTPVTCPMRVCSSCHQESKQIFTIGWFCLQYGCNMYYRMLPDQLVDLDALAYSQAFLDERQPFTGTIPSLMPELPAVNSQHHGTELGLRGGFVCPQCHHACRRRYWNWLQCEIPGCGFKKAAPMTPFPQAELEAEVEAFTKQMASRRSRHQANDALTTIWLEKYAIRSSVMGLGGYNVRQFFLTDAQERIIGSFTIFQSNDVINARPGGPDELFRSLEVEDIGLKRNPAAVAGHKLEGLTRHFQQNFGARYKFGVSVQSKGFAEAPAAILKALKRLDWAKNVAVSSATANFPADHEIGDETITNLDAHSQSFNELLALGYMEDDKINYHDDGEKELGPVVAALSLGSPCTMRFRPKRNKGFETNGFTKTGGKKNHKDILEVEMKHGDMMVMAGCTIQKLYEHAVTPEGKRRFALTARFIDPEKMELQADRDDALVKGTIPEYAAAFEYDGF